MNNEEYWDNRVENFGHTGWNDMYIYAYDQKARLKAIKEILDLYNVNGIALDYGCGVGDFSQLLSSYCNRVIGVDISENVINIAKQKSYEHKNIEYFSDVDKMNIEEKSIDIITCITVLQHITDKDYLKNKLEYFHRILKEDGLIVILEASPMKVSDNQLSSYQVVREFDEWINLFKCSKFELINYYSMYNPNLLECKSYVQYINNFFVRSMRILRFHKISKSICRSILNYISEKKQKKFNNDFFVEHNLNSYSKILIFRNG